MKYQYEPLRYIEDYVTVCSPYLIRLFANNAYCSLVGKDERNIVGVDLLRGLGKEDILFIKDTMQSISQLNPHFNYTQRILINNKEEWIAWKASGIFNENGELVEILNIGRNVNDALALKKKHDELYSTLHAYEKAIDTNIICTITDAKGVITYANDNFCRVSKYDYKDIIGKTHNLVNSRHHTPAFFSELWKTISAGNMWVGEIKNKAKDGTFYWVNSVIIPIKGQDMSVTGYLSLRTRIDQQKKNEEERANYLKSLENMLFTVSHEIRKPLTNCIGLLNMLKEEAEPNREYATMIDYLISSADELDKYSRHLNDQLHGGIANISID